jgi:deazaflavin-dependent oxidoreductase (nitroreductase family)
VAKRNDFKLQSRSAAKAASKPREELQEKCAHVGDITGCRRESPDLSAFRVFSRHNERRGRIHLIASFGGSDTAPGWYKNLVANPSVEIEVGRSRKPARARTLSDEEAEKLWPEILVRNPLHATYRKRTSRKIPIVEIAPE